MSKTSIKRKNWVKKKSRTKKSLGVLGVYHRLIVFKSNKHIYCQLVDDNTNITVLSSGLATRTLGSVGKSPSVCSTFW